MRRAVFSGLVLLFCDPASPAIEIIRQLPAVSSPGVTRRQQEQPDGFRVSKVTIEGASAFSPDQIMVLSRLKAGQVVNEQIIAKAREAILRAYANRGLIKARVRIQRDFKSPVPGAKLGVVDVSIEIDEGSVFLLRRLEFAGNATTRDQIVRRRVLQQEGEPYSKELMEKSVNRLNSLGRFEKLTMADVERRVDEKEHVVDVVVHLKEIKRRQTRR